MGKCIEHVRVGEADGIWYIEDEREHDDGYKAVVGCEIERLVSREEVSKGEGVTYDALSLRMETMRSANQRNGKLYIAICWELSVFADTYTNWGFVEDLAVGIY